MSQNPEFYFNYSLVHWNTGIYLSWSKTNSIRKFTSAQEQLREKAMYAFFGIKKYTNINKLPPQLASKLFDTMISSILMYNSEVWDAYDKLKPNHWDKSPIEKAQLRFCKSYLNVNKKATNAACRAELGRFPLNVTIDKKENLIIFYI